MSNIGLRCADKQGAKPFVFAVVCELLGAEQVRHKLGVNATGLSFDSLAFVQRSPDGRSDPMVNAGAIAAASLVPPGDRAAGGHPGRLPARVGGQVSRSG